MKINEIAQRVGITKKNIRFYEEQGLLSPQRDRENGYRNYTSEDEDTLRRIKLMRKLCLPLEEIRQMQAGRLSLSEGMRRQIATLDRQRKDLEVARQFCLGLAEGGADYAGLDADAVLRDMELKEREGTVFVNKQQTDQRTKQTAAIIAAVVFALLMVACIAILVWAWYYDPIPFGIMLVLIAVPVAAIVGVFIALMQRLKEIKGGEEDVARHY